MRSLLGCYLSSNPYSTQYPISILHLALKCWAWVSAKHNILLLPDFLFLSIDTVRGRLESWRENCSWPTPYTTVNSSFFSFFPILLKTTSRCPFSGWCNSTICLVLLPQRSGSIFACGFPSLNRFPHKILSPRYLWSPIRPPGALHLQAGAIAFSTFFLETLIPARWSPSHPSFYSSSIFQAASLLKIPECQFCKALPPIFWILIIPNSCLLLCSQSSHFLQPLWLISVLAHIFNSPIFG